MDERILDHLKLLSQYVHYLRQIAASERESFVEDYLLRGGAERYLQLAIECCINIGNRILSLVQMKTPVKTPDTYGDIFRELARLGTIPDDFLETMINMARFRNRIVHMYWDIDPEQLYEILQQHLDDFESFRIYITAYHAQEHL